MSDCTHQALGDAAEALAKVRLQGGKGVVAQQTLLRVVQQCVQTLTRGQWNRRCRIRSSNTVSECWATERGSSHLECPPQR